MKPMSAMQNASCAVQRSASRSTNKQPARSTATQPVWRTIKMQKENISAADINIRGSMKVTRRTARTKHTYGSCELNLQRAGGGGGGGPARTDPSPAITSVHGGRPRRSRIHPPVRIALSLMQELSQSQQIEPSHASYPCKPAVRLLLLKHQLSSAALRIFFPFSSF